MKKLILLLLVMVPGYLMAKNYDNRILSDTTLVVDGQISDKKLKDLDTTDILQVEIQKKGSGLDHGNQIDAILITTKAFAQKFYWDKFGENSADYKKFIPNVKDDPYPYIIDGETITTITKNRTLKLYQAAIKTIKQVKLVEHYRSTYRASISVIITTQK